MAQEARDLSGLLGRRFRLTVEDDTVFPYRSIGWGLVHGAVSLFGEKADHTVEPVPLRDITLESRP